MTTEQRQERIKVLRRQENRKRQLPVLLDNLAVITNRRFPENEVLTIEQIDKHQIELNSSDFDFNYLNLSFPINKLDELVKLLLTVEDKLSQTNYFALSHSSDIVVLSTKTNFIIEKFEDLIKLDKDTITVYDKSYKNGLWIDLYKEYWYLDKKADLIQIYELRVFGKQWIKLINEQL